MRTYIVCCRRTTTELVQVPVVVGDDECGDHAEERVDLDGVSWSGAEKSVALRKTACLATAKQVERLPQIARGVRWLPLLAVAFMIALMVATALLK